jgi:hypothetical protein
LGENLGNVIISMVETNEEKRPDFGELSKITEELKIGVEESERPLLLTEEMTKELSGGEVQVSASPFE